MTTPRKTRVALVFGGRSTEHAISCVSAGSILGALDPDLYDVLPVGITKEGRWVLAAGDAAQLTITDRRLPEITAATGDAIVLAADPTANELIVRDPADGVATLAGVDVVFPVLHGAYGEDGTIQGHARDGRPALRGCQRLRLGGGHGQRVHQEARDRRGHPGRAVRGAPGRRLAQPRPTRSASASRSSSNRPGPVPRTASPR